MPTLTDKPPAGPEWVHEIKHDGFRLIVRRSGDRVRLFTRRGHDWTTRYPWIVEAVRKLRAESCTLDGEACVAGDGGLADFTKLHSRVCDEDAFLHAFDLLEFNGEDLREEPLDTRKGRLDKLLRRAEPGVRFVDHISGDGPIIFEHACKLGLEGIVSKRRSSPYRHGRVLSWRKTRNPKAPAAMRILEETF